MCKKVPKTNISNTNKQKVPKRTKNTNTYKTNNIKTQKEEENKYQRVPKKNLKVPQCTKMYWSVRHCTVPHNQDNFCLKQSIFMLVTGMFGLQKSTGSQIKAMLVL